MWTVLAGWKLFNKVLCVLISWDGPRGHGGVARHLLLLFLLTSLSFIYQYPGPGGAPKKLCLMAPNADCVDNSYVPLLGLILNYNFIKKTLLEFLLWHWHLWTCPWVSFPVMVIMSVMYSSADPMDSRISQSRSSLYYFLIMNFPDFLRTNYQLL